MTVTYRAFVEAKMYNAYDFTADTEAEAQAAATAKLGADNIKRWEIVPEVVVATEMTDEDGDMTMSEVHSTQVGNPN